MILICTNPNPQAIFVALGQKNIDFFGLSIGASNLWEMSSCRCYTKNVLCFSSGTTTVAPHVCLDKKQVLQQVQQCPRFKVSDLHEGHTWMEGQGFAILGRLKIAWQPSQALFQSPHALVHVHLCVLSRAQPLPFHLCQDAGLDDGLDDAHSQGMVLLRGRLKMRSSRTSSAH